MSWNYRKLEEELFLLNNIKPEAFEEMQKRKLRQLIVHHLQYNEFFKEHMRDVDTNQEELTLETLAELPILERDHIIKNSLNGKFETHTPGDPVRMWYQSSGTTAEPKRIPYNDLDIITSNRIKARAFIFCGVEEGSKLLNFTSLRGPLPSGWMTNGAGRYIGPTIDRDAELDISLHAFSVINDNAQYMVVIPAFLNKLYKSLENNLNNSIEHIFLAGDGSSKKFRDHYARMFRANVHDLYCATEVGCIAAECEYGRMHYWADNLLVEVLDPKTKMPVPNGEKGELIITGLYKMGAPIIRYALHDLIFHYPLEDVCECGSTLPSISHVLGRTDHMISVSGANIYPYQLNEIIEGIGCLSGLYKFNISRPEFRDEIEIDVEIKEGIMYSEEQIKDSVVNGLKKHDDFAFLLRTGLFDEPKINVVPYGIFSLMEGKFQKIYDRREKDGC